MPPATQTSVVAALCLGRSAQETIARAMLAPGRLGLSGMYRLLLDTVRALMEALTAPQSLFHIIPS